MLSTPVDYRTHLKRALAEQGQARPGYSLRAFALKLGVSNSFLSEVLSGKKSISLELAFKIALKLGFTDSETQFFCLLVQLDQEKDPAFRQELTKRLHELNPEAARHDLSADLFTTIADWYHFAILELSHLTGVRLSPIVIAKKLGITKNEAELALARLIRLELIEKKNGEYRKSHGYVLASSGVPAEALKRFHEQILAKAAAAIREQTPKERLSATDILPIDSKQLPELDRLSQEFSAAVMKLSEKSKVKDHVYALAVHCVRLTRS